MGKKTYEDIKYIKYNNLLCKYNVTVLMKTNYIFIILVNIHILVETTEISMLLPENNV